MKGRANPLFILPCCRRVGRRRRRPCFGTKERFFAVKAEAQQKL